MTRFDFSRSGNDDSDEGFPVRLKGFNQWLVTHDTPWNDDLHKSPKFPANGWNDDNVTLLSFEEAYRRFQSTNDTGVAFRFTESSPFVGFDLDNVRNSDFTKEAIKLVQRLDTYTEVSSSGKGIHCIAEGEHLGERKNRGSLSDSGHLEVYDKDRYFVLTGDVYGGCETVESRHTVVRTVQDEYLPEDKTDASTGPQKPLDEQGHTDGSPDVTPEQIHRTIETYVEHGGVDKRLLRLWRGSDTGHQSPSEADMALVKQLYFWCKGDTRLMDKCFRASSRMRPKWDEKRGNQTYGEMTIQKVYRSNSKIFEGKYVN